MKKSQNCHVSAIIAAGGSGLRMNSKTPKQFIEINGVPLLAHTISAVSSCPKINEIILSVHKDYIVYCSDLVSEFDFKKVVKIVSGGKTRQQSVYNALLEVNSNYVAVCDGARPLVNANDITKCIENAKKYGASALATKVYDTLKRCRDDFIVETVDREHLWQIQTPQVFLKSLILDAHEKAIEDKFEATDDCALVERLGHKIKITHSGWGNIKVTTPYDLELVEGLLNG